MRKLLLSILVVMILLAPASSFAYSSNICVGSLSTTDSNGEVTTTSLSYCLQSEVGPFMAGISRECGNLGNCSFDDIITVFVNVGNWVIGVIGAVVLLMYVIGGVWFLTSAGNPERITKGKKYLKISTVGLLIVMFSYMGIFALRGTLRYGSVAITDEGYVVCTGTGTEGLACGANQVCDSQGGCQTECAITYPNSVIKETEGLFDVSTIITTYQCTDIRDVYSEDTDFGGGTFITDDNTDNCIRNLCPGDNNFLCCPVITSY